MANDPELKALGISLTADEVMENMFGGKGLINKVEGVGTLAANAIANQAINEEQAKSQTDKENPSFGGDN